jgi:uncharacterized protein (DUF2235 family)
MNGSMATSLRMRSSLPRFQLHFIAIPLWLLYIADTTFVFELRPMAKRIILLLDGTWNDADVGPFDTNIVRLREIIGHSLDKRLSTAAQSDSSAIAGSSAKLVSGRTFQGQTEHLVFYERGVGTGPLLDRIKGGSFGDGLSGNIRRAYKFLSFYYEKGDQVFVFGFSRGAYTARSLVGYIGAAGLLTRANCTPELEHRSWTYYRTDPNDRLPGIWTQLTPLVNDRETFRIDCLGVFDTVGALGVPLPEFYRINRQSYEFHDVDLSSITNVNLHALAVDEHREPFVPAVWRKPKFKSFSTVTEQVWFVGSHADVGGGYIEEARRSEANCKALDSSWSSAVQHESRRSFYRTMRLALRSIANRNIAGIKWHQTNVGYDRHAEAIGEMVHTSVLERLGAAIEAGRIYAPVGITALLDIMQSTYEKNITEENAIKIVGWTGAILSPIVDDDATTARDLITRARQRIASQ